MKAGNIKISKLLGKLKGASVGFLHLVERIFKAFSVRSDNRARNGRYAEGAEQSDCLFPLHIKAILIGAYIAVIIKKRMSMKIDYFKIYIFKNVIHNFFLTVMAVVTGSVRQGKLFLSCLLTGADRSVKLNISRTDKRNLGKHRAYKLVNENRKEGYI